MKIALLRWTEQCSTGLYLSALSNLNVNRWHEEIIYSMSIHVNSVNACDCISTVAFSTPLRQRNWGPAKPGGICGPPQLWCGSSILHTEPLPSTHPHCPPPTPHHPPLERRSSPLASRPEKWQCDMLMFRFTVWLNEDAVSCLYRVTLPFQLCFKSKQGERVVGKGFHSDEPAFTIHSEGPYTPGANSLSEQFKFFLKSIKVNGIVQTSGEKTRTVFMLLCWIFHRLESKSWTSDQSKLC